jgi:hypothetical protein
MSEQAKLDHPCKDTCSGWKQGHEKGRAEGVRWCVERRRSAPTGAGNSEFFPDVAADWLESQVVEK